MLNKYLLWDSSSFLGTSSKISLRRSKNSSFLLRNGNSPLQVSAGDEWFLVRPLILDTMRSSCFDKTLELYCYSRQLLFLKGLTVIPVGGVGVGVACDSNARASLFSWTTGKGCSHYDKEDSSAKKEISSGSQATNKGVCVCTYVHTYRGQGWGEISTS